MLYGGDVVADGDVHPNDQPRHGAIHMRLADYPWGPWSRATPLLWRESMRGYLECDAPPSTGCDTPAYKVGDPSTYTPGTWLTLAAPTVTGCVSSQTNLQPIEPNPNQNCSSTYQRGIMYAPELLATWTNAGAYDYKARMGTTTIYFLVSTWMPYQVVLAAADLHTTSQTYLRGVSVQLRDYQNQMIAVNSDTVSSTAGGTLGGATGWLVTLADGTTPGRAPAIGDTVVFRSSADNGGYYLSRSGDYSRFDATATTSLTTRQEWILESTDTTAYPDGTPIVFGKTPFYQSADRHLKSKSVGLRNLIGSPAGDATWTMTWGCQQEAGTLSESCK